MIRFFYNLLYPLGLLLFLPGQISKLLRRGNYRHKFGQRFGVYDRDVQARLASHRCTWIHAVSVGEVAIALKLSAKLSELDPEFFCVITTTTTTGFAFAAWEAGERMEVLYSPLDFWPIMRRAYAVIRPIRVILVEAEVWPNLAAEARGRGLPLALVNARLSQRSERRFRRFLFLVEPTFRCLDLVCVQEPEDIERWIALRVPRERIQNVGSIKYDPAETKVNPELPLQVLRAFGVGGDRPVLFGGSTHAGEEEVLGEIFQRLRADFPAFTLIIAPRHVERAGEIRAQLMRLGLDVSMRSEAETARMSPPDCILLDTTGELQNWYAVATIVFVGKSLTARGGQNPVEPILADKPVLFGPHMENFSALAEALVANEGAIQIRDPNSLQEKIAWLLRDRGAALRLVANAQAVLARHSGATARTADLVMKLESRRDAIGDAIRK
ncbi:MAG TPA: glycosyltransferase N-terminal domain-containing protein [Chthoniobacterales bacterium]|nr:glycosyltransferase N-terminal domain-containing protein [Chthoniobacterales bacterium]